VSGDRELDVVVFGATGFAGRLVAGYLAGHAPGGVRIGLAGRSARRLADVRAGLGEAASAWPLLAADSPWRAPDYLATLPARRLARPEEVAEVVRYLVGEDAAFCTGEVLSPNSGAVI